MKTNNQKTKWKYLLIVIILALIAGGGIFYYQKLLNKETKIHVLEIPLKENKTPIYEVSEEDLGALGLPDLQEKGGMKINLKEGRNIIIEKIGSIIEGDNIIFKIDEDISVETPKYEVPHTTPESFDRGYTIYYKNKQVYRDAPTALNVYLINYKDKKYIAIEIASAGAGGVFSYLSLFDFTDKENIKFLDTISANGSLKDVLKEIDSLIR